MKQEFWHNAWSSGKTGWQQQRVNTRLQRFWPSLEISSAQSEESRLSDEQGADPGLQATTSTPSQIQPAAVLVPLCGSSVDMMWLLDQGLHVVGCELSEIAVETFFTDPQLGAKLEYEVEQLGEYKVYRSENITLCCGDYFTLDPSALALPPLRAAYDRAALVAMPAQMRPDYVKKLHQLLEPKAPVLLVGFSYDQQKMNGPPFSVTDAEVDALFGDGFSLQTLEQNSGPEILGNLADRGLDTMIETVYLATRLQKP